MRRLWLWIKFQYFRSNPDDVCYGCDGECLENMWWKVNW